MTINYRKQNELPPKLVFSKGKFLLCVFATLGGLCLANFWNSSMGYAKGDWKDSYGKGLPRNESSLSK